MGQANEAAAGRPVFLVPDTADALGVVVTEAGFRPASCADIRSLEAALHTTPPIVLADLRELGRLPEIWGALSDLVARRRGALVAIGSLPLLGVAVREGATHVAFEADAGTLRVVLASAATHVDRMAQRVPRDAIRPGGDAAGRPDTRPDTGWSGPGDALAQAEAFLTAGPVALALLIGIERLDVVNAAYSRAVGDQVLGSAGRRITRVADDVLGPGALTVRVSGSAFLLLWRGAGDPGDIAAAVVRRLGERLADPFVVVGGPVSVGHRIAAATSTPGEGGAALLDRLRAQVKDAPDAGDDGSDALAIDLHGAIERDEIELLFQPQVTMADGRIVGVEALARWAHPHLGTLGAEPLLAAAARAGLAGTLSAHIQSLALRRAAAWAGRTAALRLAINVTAQDIASAGFAARVLARLEDSGFPPERLTVEVTETGLILDLEAAAAALADLQLAGCRIALDDFGTGYSSLAYLKALPIDYLKIDKAITRDVTGSARDRAVIEGVVGIARALGLGTIVEGVETVEQRDGLSALGCDLYQGFLCAEPIGADALARLLEDW